MARTSQIRRLPQTTQDVITTMRGKGDTLDEIRAALSQQGIAVARSTLGAHLKKLDAEIEQGRAARNLFLVLTGEVTDLVVRDLQQGEKISQAMERAFGLSRAPRSARGDQPKPDGKTEKVSITIRDFPAPAKGTAP